MTSIASCTIWRAENIDKYEYLHKETTEQTRKLQIADKEGKVIENIVFR
jgi:hypothetical protein